MCTSSQGAEPHFLVCVCCFYFMGTFRRKGIDDPSPLISEPYKKRARQTKFTCSCLINCTAGGVLSCEHGLSSHYNVSSVSNSLLVPTSLCCGGGAKAPGRKGGKLLYIFSLCEPFSSLFVRFQSCKPFTREHASLLPLCCRESTTSGLSQLQSEPGFQDKRNDSALQNAFSKTVLFLLCLDLDKTEGKTKGINYFGE